MRVAEDYEVLESVVVEMDPVMDRFAGVLVELVYDGERHVLAWTALSAPATRCCGSVPGTLVASIGFSQPCSRKW